MKTKTVTLSHIEVVTLAACMTDATIRAAAAGLPQNTLVALEQLAHKVLDIAESIRGGALEFGIAILEPGEKAPGEKAPKTEAEEILDAMGLKLEVVL